MPSTTNSLESYHGHHNKMIPRNNNFYAALCRLSLNLMRHNKEYAKRINHNYNFLKRRIKKQLKCIEGKTLLREINFYEATTDSCNCSSTKLESAQLGFNIPCIHQLSLMTPQVFPDLPEYKFNLNDQFDSLIVKCNPINDDLLFKSFDTNEKSDIINTIKFYSRYKGTEIDSYVEKITDYLKIVNLF